MPRRKRKDPKQPKRALTAYMMFSQTKRAYIKDQNPEVGFGQVGKLLGEAWKALNEEEKLSYNEMAANDKLRYQREIATYKEEHPDSSDEEEKPRKKRKKDPNAPKKPCSAFFHFSKRMRPTIKEQHPDASFGQLGKLIGEEWAKLAPEDKKQYEELAAIDKERYAKENKEYLNKKAQEDSSDSESSNSDSDSDSSDSSGSSASSSGSDSD